MDAKPKAVLAFSGGLDTTYCALWLQERGYEVHTVTVQTDSATDEIAAIEQRARSLGVAEHRTIDARRELFDDVGVFEPYTFRFRLDAFDNFDR